MQKHIIKGAIPLPANLSESDINADMDIAFIRKAAALGSKNAQQCLEEMEKNQH